MVKDFQGRDTQLKLLEPNEAKRMSGVILAIDGNNTKNIHICG